MDLNGFDVWSNLPAPHNGATKKKLKKLRFFFWIWGTVPEFPLPLVDPPVNYQLFCAP